MAEDNNAQNILIQEVYTQTLVLRKPLSGIVSGYHELPYILIAPDDEDQSVAVQVNGQVQVSPKFVISAATLGERFGEVFNPETFDKDLQGRLFSFAYARKRNYRLESMKFEIQNFTENAKERLDRIHDDLMRAENMHTALIFGPRFHYYPVSIDKFINEVLDREFKF